MRRAVEGDIRADDGPIADAHLACVEHDTVEVYEDVAADVEVEAVVGGEGRFDPRFGVKEGVVFLGGRGWSGEGSEVACYPLGIE